MKNKIHETLESIGTVAWFLMDFCWMSGYTLACWIVMSVSCIFLLASLFTFSGDKKSERFVFISAFGWFLMNSFWMLHDITEKRDWLLLMAKIFFGLASLFVIVSIIIARKEKGNADFRRLKIN